ncbi:hypothetical protein SLOPH_577 [Spraguea lophii 42_110]|uniref:Uncharacterized protein n=1 Tax=Spraguea lophii (strain 42_110) TaxID=1358809 RepID=S7WDH9_SPRLO|nr:hypothetical protein SLOPH_577 [Spraguea lophii 42_110]
MRLRLSNILTLYTSMLYFIGATDTQTTLGYSVCYLRSAETSPIPAAQAGITVSASNVGSSLTITGTGKVGNTAFPYKKNDVLLFSMTGTDVKYVLFDVFYDGSIFWAADPVSKNDEVMLIITKDVTQFTVEINIPAFQEVEGLITTSTNSLGDLNTDVPADTYPGFNDFIKSRLTITDPASSFKPAIVLALNVISNKFMMEEYAEFPVVGDRSAAIFVQVTPGFSAEVRAKNEIELNKFVHEFTNCFVTPTETMDNGLKKIKKWLAREKAKEMYRVAIKNEKCKKDCKKQCEDSNSDDSVFSCSIKDEKACKATEIIEGYNHCLKVSKAAEMIVSDRIECKFDTEKYQNICTGEKQYPLCITKALALVFFNKEFCAKFKKYECPEQDVLLVSDYNYFIGLNADPCLEEIAMADNVVNEEEHVDIPDKSSEKEEEEKVVEKKKPADKKEKKPANKKPERKSSGMSTGTVVIISVVCVVVGTGIGAGVGYGIYTMM